MAFLSDPMMPVSSPRRFGCFEEVKDSQFPKDLKKPENWQVLCCSAVYLNQLLGRWCQTPARQCILMTILPSLLRLHSRRFQVKPLPIPLVFWKAAVLDRIDSSVHCHCLMMWAYVSLQFLRRHHGSGHCPSRKLTLQSGTKSLPGPKSDVGKVVYGSPLCNNSSTISFLSTCRGISEAPKAAISSRSICSLFDAEHFSRWKRASTISSRRRARRMPSAEDN